MTEVEKLIEQAVVTVEHHPGYCVAWRPAGTYRTGWTAAYSDHGGDRARAEAAARLGCARGASWAR